jgi:hypothetical protein
MHSFKEQNDLIEAYRLGAKIEYKWKYSEVWHCISHPTWSWNNFEYRIKPEAKTAYQLEVEQAHKDGKAIEFRYKDSTYWALSSPTFKWTTFDYRIKEEEPAELDKDTIIENLKLQIGAYADLIEKLVNK